MAYICDDCQYIFSKKRTSCPFCGGRVYNNKCSESTLLSDGYSWAPGQKTKELDTSLETHGDHFEDLRQSFFEQHGSEDHLRSIPEVAPQVSVPNNQSETTANTAPEKDYFSQFDNFTFRADDIPMVDPHASQTQTVPPQRPDPYEHELQELERQRQQAERQYRRRAIFNSILNIRWRVIFRILFILILIIATIFIWNMRYIIFSSIINFLISLFPIILIIWVLWYFIRSLF